jgi:4-carboxymuconolactone decarboxylase
MLILAALIGAQAANEYKIMVVAALNVGVPPVEIKEILYQSVAYVGMARAFDFLHATNEALTSRGHTLPLARRSPTPPRRHGWTTVSQPRRRFSAGSSMRCTRNRRRTPLHIQRFLSASCFGDFYTRTGLDLKMRELVTLTILVASGGLDAQVKGHVRGNVNVGNGREVLIDVITQLLPWVGYPRTLNALAAVNEVAPDNGNGTKE